MAEYLTTLTTTMVLFLYPVIEILPRPKIWVEVPDSLFNPQPIIMTDTGKSIQTGIFQTADISEFVSDNEAALKLAKLSDSYDTSGKIWFWTGLGIGLTGIVTGSGILEYKKDAKTGNRVVDSSSTQTKAGFITLGVSALWYIVGTLVGASKLTTSRHYLLKSLNTYNGVYEKTSSQSYNFSAGSHSHYLGWSNKF